MSKSNNIQSLSALRERKKEIEAEQELAVKGLSSSLASAPAKAKEYAIEDLALPALGIGLAVYVGYRIFRSNDGPGARELQRPETLAHPDYAAASRYSPPERVVRPAMQSTAPAPTPQPVSQQQQLSETAESAFNFGSLIAAGKILVPAAQAIIGIVQNQQTQNKVEEVTEDV